MQNSTKFLGFSAARSDFSSFFTLQHWDDTIYFLCILKMAQPGGVRGCLYQLRRKSLGGSVPQRSSALGVAAGSSQQELVGHRAWSE